jgi:hypothetical protein
VGLLWRSAQRRFLVWKEATNQLRQLEARKLHNKVIVCCGHVLHVILLSLIDNSLDKRGRQQALLATAVVAGCGMLCLLAVLLAVVAFFVGLAIVIGRVTDCVLSACCHRLLSFLAVVGLKLCAVTTTTTTTTTTMIGCFVRIQVVGTNRNRRAEADANRTSEKKRGPCSQIPAETHGRSGVCSKLLEGKSGVWPGERIEKRKTGHHAASKCPAKARGAARAAAEADRPCDQSEGCGASAKFCSHAAKQGEGSPAAGAEKG